MLQPGGRDRLMVELWQLSIQIAVRFLIIPQANGIEARVRERQMIRALNQSCSQSPGPPHPRRH